MTHHNNTHLALKIAKAVDAAGGTAYFVGGYVRDKLLNISNKDLDMEVHGITTNTLEEILDNIGQKMEYGKSFGVYSLKGSTIDIALPRKESCTGIGHRDFKISTDPFLGTLKAAKRRDFTINALMENVLTGEIIDHFNGISDLKNGIIRHIHDNSFTEDPLRVLRAAQFAARFNFKISEETKALCQRMNLAQLSCERVFEELKKAMLKSEKPSLFFQHLSDLGHSGYWFSKVYDLKGIPQSEKYHKEGDVFTHTMMVLDEAAKFRNKAVNPFWFMLSALVHDFGKITATSLVNGEIHAYNHEIEGITAAKMFLSCITKEKRLISYVINMVEHHMKPNQLFAQQSSIKATNKMFDLAVSPLDLIYLSMADSLGKIPHGDCNAAADFLFKRLGIYNEYMSRPFVEGADLIAAGLVPDKEFSTLLSYAHKLRLAGISKESALKQTLSLHQQFKLRNQTDNYL